MPRPSLLLQPFKAKRQKPAPLMLHNTPLDSQPGCTLESSMGFMKMPMLRPGLVTEESWRQGEVWALACLEAPWGILVCSQGSTLVPHPSFRISTAPQSFPVIHQSLQSQLSVFPAPSPPLPLCCVTNIHGACPIPWPLRASTFSTPVTSFLLDSIPDSYPQCHTWDLATAHFQGNPFRAPMHPACKQEPGADVLPSAVLNPLLR